MWSNVISIDGREKAKYARLLAGVEDIYELSVAVEKSKNRNYIYMAGLCDFADAVRAKIENLICDVILTDYKLEYYLESLKYGKLDYSTAALLSTLIYLDYDVERAYIKGVLAELSCYDVDGIFHFRLRPLRAGWREISEMCNRLFEVGTEDADIYSVISYITATKTQKPVELALENRGRPVLLCVADNSEIPIRDVFGSFDYNVINAVISASATKLTVKNVELNKDTVKALKHIVRVKVY